MIALTPGARVTHANVCHAYGPGELIEIVPSPVRPPCKAYVLFDGERARRLVWLGDLTPAAMPRICYPPERAGEAVLPMVPAAVYRAEGWPLRVIEPPSVVA